MKDFYLHAWADNNVDKILKKINVCIIKKQKCRLWIMCAEEYDYIPISNYELSTFVFQSSLVETFLVLGALEHNNPERYKKLGINVILWPTFWFYKTIADVNVTNLKTKRDFNKLFICLNNRGHSHRIKSINQIVDNNLFNDGIISWHDETVKVRSLSRKKLPLESEKNKPFYDHVLPDEVNNCLINLVTESTIDNHLIDISEKTINAIVAEMPFIIVGCAGIHKKLESMGFELYTEIFDYEFDSFKNVDERIYSLIKQLGNIKEKYSRRYNQIYKILQPKISHNKLQLLKIVNQNQNLPQEVIKFPAYLEILNTARQKGQEIRRKQ